MKLSRLASKTILLLGLVSLFGCATVFKGTTQNMPINSNPAKATYTVKTSGGIEIAQGTTPGVVKLAKKHEYTVTVKLPGYKEATVNITQSLEGWFWGNLICGGVVGMLIDYVSGAMWDLEPEQVMITLVSTSTSSISVPQIYAVFRAYDNNGQLRTMIVPMIKEKRLASEKL